ncbi:MAG: pilus assembly protein PilM, partial [Rubripirellula sp.]|nr:pilus assembly protein PilM [Rubripirellula sp.]
YGLCLQGLGSSQMHTSLVPREILTERMIRAKKPWTVAALAMLLLGMSGHYAFTERSWATTHDDLWSNSVSAVTAMEGYKSDHQSKDDELDAKLSYLNVMGKEVSGNAERRLKWLEIIKTVNNAVPRKSFVDGKIPTWQEVPFDEREDIHVTRFDTKYYDDLKDWWTDELAQRYREEFRNWALLTNKELDEEEEAALLSDAGPEGAGWVFELSCYHDYNKESLTTGGGEIGSNHVRRVMTSSFLPDNPLSKTVELPRSDGGKEIYTLAEMGISYPLMLDDNDPKLVKIANPDYDPAAGFDGDEGETAGDGEDDKDSEPAFFQVPRLEFVFQMVWQEQPLADRVAKKEAERAAEKERQAEEKKRAADAAAATP